MADKTAPGSAKLPEGLCIAPWIHLFADERGMMSPCCMVLDHRHANRDERGAPYRIHQIEDLDPAWNSAYMRELRQDMLAGRRPAACRRCHQHEDLGIRSYRQALNKMFRHHLQQLDPGADGRAEPVLRSVDIRLGNLCNLRCRMCSPISSRALVEESAEIFGLRPDHRYLERVKNQHWYADPGFWDFLEAQLPTVERLHFGGGEPLLVAEMFDFLDRLVASGRASDITLSYITNLTVLPSRIRQLWPRFKEVRLTLSVDAHGELNSFIRHPSRWPTVAANLLHLDHHADELNLASATLNTTVQVFNVLALTELFEYTLAHLHRICPYPTLSLLNQPPCFSIQILPRELKTEAVRRLDEFLRRHDGRWPEGWRGGDLDKFLGGIEGVKKHLMEAHREDEIAEFLRWNEVYDRHRGQDLRQAIPELAPLYERASRVVQDAG